MKAFKDIPLFTVPGSWECSFDMKSLLSQVATWQSAENLNIDPDFQRIHVWKESQQIGFMEFMFRGGKTGRTLYFNNPNWYRPNLKYNEFVLVDGKQRLEAIRRFYNNEIKVFGGYLNDYKDEADSIRQSRMIVSINDLPSKKAVLNWYVEFNSGGTVHTEEEINRVKMMMDKEN